MKLKPKHSRSTRQTGAASLHLRKQLRKSAVAVAVATILAAPAVVWAQSAESTLQGKAQPNATITARNVANGAVRRTNASAEGYYTLNGLVAGTYRVDAGPGTEQDITLAVSSTVAFDFVDSAARKAELEEVVVTGKVREVRTSEVGTVVPLQQIEVTPQITRNFLEFADTVPGVIFNVDASGNTTLRGGAQVNGSVNVYIDGVGMKDYVTGGGVSGQSGTSKNGDPGNPFPQLALQEYKVITSNYNAEFDQVASAAISAQTKSGTNQFEGEAFGDFTNANLRAETPAERDAAKKQGGSTYEYGFAQGGPIIKDVLHFFVTYEEKDFTLPNVVFPAGTNGATLDNLQGRLPPSVYSQFGPTSNPFTEYLGFAKLDWEPSDRDRFELTNLIRRESSVSGAAGQLAASAAISFENDNERLMLLWQHAGDRWLNEVRFTYEDQMDAPDQASGASAVTYVYHEGTVSSEAIQVGGQDPRQYFRYAQSGYGLQDDFTLNDLHWLGDHTLKVGLKYKAVDLTARDASSGANYFYGVDSTGTSPTPYKAIFTITNPGQDLTATSDDKQLGVYFQDTWVPTPRLTLDIGLRWDYESVPSFENFRLPASIVSAIQGPFPGVANETYAQALALGGINVKDYYVSPGHSRGPQDDEFQPRLGFSFDLSGDNRHVLFGGYGRAYDRNAFDIMSLERSKLAISEPTINFYGGGFSDGSGANNLPCLTPQAANGTTCIAWNPAYLGLQALQARANGTIGEVDLVNNNLRNPYSDQFSLGIRDRIGDWNTSIAVAQINSYDGIIGHLGNRYANGAYYQNGTQWGSQGVPGINNNFVLFDNGAKDRDTQVLISAEKPYTKESGWGATIAYTYSHAVQNNPGAYQSNNDDAFDLPFPALYPMLPSSTIPRHRLVLTGSIDGPWGTLFAGKVSLATPIPAIAIEGCPTTMPMCQMGGLYNAYPVVGYEHDSLQEKVVDLQITKNFNVYRDYVSAYVRLDVLNVFDTAFYAKTNYTPGGSPPYPVFNTTGDIYGVPRTLKLTGGVKW